MTLKSTDVAYLKHSGKQIDVKVSCKLIDGSPVLYIRDLEFYDFNRARMYLIQIAETELGRP